MADIYALPLKKLVEEFDLRVEFASTDYDTIALTVADVARPGLLLAGFFFLRIEGAVLLAAMIALLDALPLFGAGVALVPWALAELLLSNPSRAAGLALLFAVILAVRNGLEPHVVGRQIGLHPLVSLISFYLGWRLAGLAGMLLAPILVLILVKLQEWGYSRLWR